MTNKEAIAELKAMPIIYPITNGENDRASRLMQARDMAIKALKQEPCEDAISREDALMCLTGEIKETDTIETIIARSGRRIRKLPPVNPQPKTGHWVEHPEIETSTPEYLMFYECSECGDKQCFCKSDIHKKRFCGNCGCRMVEPQERSEVTG